jgi:peptide/nickel transport system substrate-binding protein
MGASLHQRRRRWYAGVALAAGALVLAACGGSSGGGAISHNSTTNTGKVTNGGTLSYILDEDVAGFNINFINDNEFVLAEILDQVWPNVWVTQPNLTLGLNTDLVTSATVTNTSPQTIVYNINPKATWSDGVPINAADFIYNWQAQSGNPKFKDLGGKAFEPASTAGYNQIKTVTGSNGGKTVTVVLSKPFGDWKSLFSDLMPAHIAKKVGFNNGFQTFGPAEQVSGGAFEIQSYTKGQSVVEVPNPHFWGAKAHLSKLVFRILTDDNQAPAAIQNGEANMVNPALASTAFYQQVKAIPGFSTSVTPGLEFQHLDFNQANPYLAQHAVRQAIAYGLNRPEMMQRIVDPLIPNSQPLNGRIFMKTQPQFQDESNGLGDYNPAKAKQELTSDGMTMGSDGYFHPNFGPEKGQDLSLTLSTTSGVPVRQQIEQLMQASLKQVGIKIVIKNYTADTYFGKILPGGQFDIGEFAWVLNPFASANQSIYCSYTNKAVCAGNYDHYANKQVDQLFNKALVTVDPTQATALYNNIDKILWQDMVTLPLFQQPVLYGWSSKFGNILPNTSNAGIPWNAQDWGVLAS